MKKLLSIIFIVAFLMTMLPIYGTDRYLRSFAAGASNGTNWTDAYTNITVANTGMSAGDRLWIADDHAETNTALTITSPGTGSSWCTYACVNTHTVVPPTGFATTASITTTNANNINYAGFAYMYGVTLNHGSGNTLASALFTSAASWGWILENCNIYFISTGNSILTGGNAGATGDDQYLELRNTNVKFSGANQGMRCYSRFNWNGGSVLVGTAPTTLYTPVAAFGRAVYFNGVDLSALGSGKNLVSAGVASSTGEIYFRNCKLGSSVSVITGTIASQGGMEVYLDNSDSSNTNYRFEHYKYQGSIVNETTVVRTGGASDGTTPLSHKFVTLATGPTFASPLYGPWMGLWNEGTGSVVTNTIEILHNSATNLKNNDIFLQVEGLTTSNFPLSVFSDNRAADPLVTAADLPAGVGIANWTTNGLANANSQKLLVAYTPQVKGVTRARVCMIKSNYTVYVDPNITVGTGTGRRQYNIQGGQNGIYINEMTNAAPTATSSGGAFSFSQ